MKFTVEVPVEVEVLVQGSDPQPHASVMAFSNVPELTGHGTISESADGNVGWDIFFRCGDEFPLEGFAYTRDTCMSMVEKHIRMVARMQQEDENDDNA